MTTQIAQDPNQSVAEPKLHQVLDYEGNLIGDLPDIDPDTQIRMYRFMKFIRQLDERMMILQRQGRIGFYGACTGQEAPPVATAAALRTEDWIFPALREGVTMLYRGYSLETYICQVFGNSGDALKGRQMPSHYADKSVQVVSWGSCIGSQISQAVGAAQAAKLTKTGDVAVAFMGDGATSSADFHTGMNFASVFNAPCLFICQNNNWAISTPTDAQTTSRTIAEKAIAYGMPYVRVDGNDALASYEVVQEAAARARAGDGPTFIEMVTYRIGAHSSSDDPRVYRDENEVVQWKTRDPLDRMRKYLTSVGLWSDAEQAKVTVEFDTEIMATVERAEKRPPPSPESLFEDVYADTPWHLKEQAEAHRGAR